MENINVTLKDFPYICRVCLSNRNLKPFKQLYDLFKLFEKITNLEIEYDEIFPKDVCTACINQLETVSSFISVSKTNDSKLKQLANENKSEPFTEEDSLDSLPWSNDLDDDLKIKSEDGIENVKIEAVPQSNEENERDEKSTKQSTRLANYEHLATKNKLNKPRRKSVGAKINRYKCSHCEKAFRTELKLNLHMRSHTKETPFQCNICFKKFRYSSNLKKHDDVVHKGIKRFKCDVCGKEFATLLRRSEHSRIHTGERPYICSYCGMGFKQHSARFAHEMRHKIKNGEVPKSDKKPKKYIRKKPDDISKLSCTICDKIFSSKQALGVHTLIHIGEKTFLCTVCGKGFLRKSYLDAHSRTHTGEKPYECTTCGKRFSQATCFKNHLLIHKGERSFKCEVCQKTFIQSGHLQTHMRTHTGEKPYKCTFCGKAFALNGHLKAHTRMHTGERPERKQKKSNESNEDSDNYLYQWKLK